MKNQKLLISVAIVCLLVGASGTAIARNDCPAGSIVGGTYGEIVIDVFKDCRVVGVKCNAVGPRYHSDIS